jgi:hypothetical protein
MEMLRINTDVLLSNYLIFNNIISIQFYTGLQVFRMLKDYNLL